uniref:Uncharacterized protein n=1 Tax=Vespula pensylvanica TaxID=30213 RepID=A0A834P0R0_VESPE|nr:hypothetical protein H0235_008897 [Vespula pensylvanica]
MSGSTTFDLSHRKPLLALPPLKVIVVRVTPAVDGWWIGRDFRVDRKMNGCTSCIPSGSSVPEGPTELKIPRDVPSDTRFVKLFICQFVIMKRKPVDPMSRRWKHRLTGVELSRYTRQHSNTTR